MRKLVLTIATLTSLIGSAGAQTLFTYGGNPVSKQEFLRVYQKNAMNKKPDMSDAALNEYFDLYTLFRMKVKEAELRKMDTIPSIQRELSNYRKQLSKSYLTDADMNKRLITEAYDRMKEERHIAHIMLNATPNMGPEDTMRLYKTMDSLYNLLSTGKADFKTLAPEFSEDKASKDKGGDLGYMAGLQTIYPFENAMYSTEVGKVSKPFRTQMGYHIVKVLDKRPGRGEVQVAHILLLTPKSKGEEGILNAQRKMDTIKAEMKKGVSFEELAKKYSEDKYTVKEGGLMKPFGTGRYAPEFEDASFGLKKPGDISQPVRTDYGFHIIKLVSKTPLKPYDSMAAQLKRLVENDSRAQMARDLFFDRMKTRNGFKEYPANFDELVAKTNTVIPDTGKAANQFKAADFGDMNKPVFSLGKNNYSQSDLMVYAETLTRGRMLGQRKTSMNEIYKMYVDNVVNDAEEHRLETDNEDFRNLMQEYRDGIMLFELMDQQVWGKASRDTTGLTAFYEANKAKYMWEPGFEGSVYHFKTEDAMKAGVAFLNKKPRMEDQEIADSVNTESTPDALSVMQGHYEFAKFKEANREVLTKGAVTRAVKNDDGSYTMVRVDEVYNTPTQKTLEDARGYVIAEYQDYLEKQWNAELRSKYPVKREDAVFKSMVSK
jgi:peptidyl-prolyl cis-trans isomerase SurA